jgi:hypothetical protein
VAADVVDVAFDAGRDAVRALFAAQGERIAALEAEIEELKRLLSRSSNNSSLPPSRDSREARQDRKKKRSSGKKQGGQAGHKGRHRKLVANPDCVVEHRPAACSGCGGQLGEDAEPVGDPVCHQVSEIITRVEVTEHRRMRLRCGCGACTLAPLPDGVPAGAFGPGVQAAAATLTAARIGRREAARIFNDLFGLQISVSSLQALLERASIALEAPYTEILAALDDAAVRGADETSWPRAGDGQWLSVAISEEMALFQIARRRDRDAAKALLGEEPGGVIVTDRYAVYLFLDDTRRQLCLAHLARDLVALGERDGAPGKLGRALARELGRVFCVLHAPGRDPATRRPAASARGCSITRLRCGPSPAPRASPRQTTHPSVRSATRSTGAGPATAPKPIPATESWSDSSHSARRVASRADASTATSPPRLPPTYTATRSRRSSPRHPDRTP